MTITKLHTFLCRRLYALYFLQASHSILSENEKTFFCLLANQLIQPSNVVFNIKAIELHVSLRTKIKLDEKEKKSETLRWGREAHIPLSRADSIIIMYDPANPFYI